MGSHLATAVAMGWLLIAAPTARAQESPPVPPTIKKCRASAPIGQVGGDAVLAFRVMADGRVDSSTVRVMSVDGISEAEALSAALRFVPGCRFTPARGPRGPVAISVTQPIHFPLSGVPLDMLESDTLQAVEEAPVALGCRLLTLLSPRTVVAEFTLGADGKPEPATVRIVRATVPTPLTAVQKVVASCRYAPARARGVPSRILVQQPLVFE